jgi:phenylacetate-CoA ligase
MSAPGFLLSPRLRRHFGEAEARRAALSKVSDEEWVGRQLTAFQQVWADACAEVPYYGDLVAQGGAPRDIRSWQDVRSIPVLNRQAFQEHPDRFLRRSRQPDNYMRTAGSTGTPLKIGMTQTERDLMRVVKIAAWQEFGYTPASRVFLMWGHSHLLGTGARGKVNHLKRTVADRLLGYRRVDAYRLSPAICAEYAEALIAFRPMAFISYASALDLFARYTVQYRERFRALGLRFVLATAEPPPRPDTIARLEDLFGCPVVQEYGGAEFGQVAFKRGREPFEVYHDLNYLECTAAGPGDEGAEPALVTALYPRYVPLIRYRVGDALAGAERLPNGHVHRFAAVAGRINDVITLDGGDSIHSVAIFHCIHQEDDVHSIQVVLTDEGVDACLVANQGDRPAMEERIRRRLAQVHPSLAQVRFRYVEDHETSRAGKRRWFVDRRTPTPCVESPAS